MSKKQHMAKMEKNQFLRLHFVPQLVGVDGQGRLKSSIIYLAFTVFVHF